MTTPAANLSPRLRLRQKRQRRGVAIVLVLGALTILTVMLAEFQDETSAEFGAALSQRDALKAEYAARSAVHLSQLLIATEPTIRKALGPLFLMMSGGKQTAPQIPVWDFADQVLGAFNDETGTEAFTSLASVNLAEGKNLGLTGAGFEVKIVDEESKINFNAAARGDAFSQTRLGLQILGLISHGQYAPMFEQRDRDGQFSDRSAICSAIIDWADPDSDTAICDVSGQAQQNAAEDSFYQRLKKPYPRKNAAFDSLEEVRLVRGVGDDFWATFIDPEPDKPDKRVVTVWGSGKVNVNTANGQTILAVVCSAAVEGSPVCIGTAESAKFLSAIQMVKGFTMGAPLFNSPKGFINAMKGKGMFKLAAEYLELKPIEFKSETELVKAITTESKVFSIYATGYVKSGQRETRVKIHTVVDFRNAPPPGLPTGIDDKLKGLGIDLSGSGGGSATGTGGSGGSGAATGQEGADAAIAEAFKPSPGGNIIYYRVD
jgi:general secretion pathway protein K